MNLSRPQCIQHVGNATNAARLCDWCDMVIGEYSRLMGGEGNSKDVLRSIQPAAHDHQPALPAAHRRDDARQCIGNVMEAAQ